MEKVMEMFINDVKAICANHKVEFVKVTDESEEYGEGIYIIHINGGNIPTYMDLKMCAEYCNEEFDIDEYEGYVCITFGTEYLKAEEDLEDYKFFLPCKA